MTAASTASAPHRSGTIFGHPTGLFTLFFAEMWERFSYYGMRALLVFYMIKGFLGYNDTQAYGVYGAYTALVYMTPYFGGILADRLLGQRRAVIFGGLLMAGGHLLMGIENEVAFFTALALLICGNGFFKPNISTIVGSLYPKSSDKKDGGFTIFYMGINLGAAMSPIICGYVGETYGWHYGFGLATIGMLIGVAVFVAPTRLTQLAILGGAIATAVAMPFFQDTLFQLVVRIFLGVALTAAGVIAFAALGRGGLPKWAGEAPDKEKLARKIGGVIRADLLVYLGTALAVVAFAFVVQRNEVAKWTLSVTGALALGYILYEAVFRCATVQRHRLFVVLFLMFFSLVFWACFEQAGSSVNNFTDRNVDRMFEERAIDASDVGTTIRFRVPIQTEDPALAELPLLGQEQLGYENDGKVFTMTELTAVRHAEREKDGPEVVEWQVSESNVGMGIGGAEVPASEFQAANPIYILLFGLLFSALWTFLGARNRDPSTPVKFGLGLLQLGLGFGALWYGAEHATERGMVGLSWLLLGYLLHTTGELCLSPVGLSMVTKLSPTRMVSTIMGAWFLATAFSNLIAGMIAALTGVHGEEGAATVIPPPSETVHVYGDVFGMIGLVAIGFAVLCFALSPLLTKWMHTDVQDDDEDEDEGNRVSGIAARTEETAAA